MQKLSVIVPVYNVEKYLHRCVDSIINQTYSNLEIILVDDGSPDNSGIICDEYAKKDARVKVMHQKNSGVSAARNAGLDVASGEYIAFVDSDDWINDNMYSALIYEIEANNVDMVKCGVYETDTVHGRNYTYKDNETFNKEDCFEKYFEGFLWTIACNGIYKSELAQKVLFLENLVWEDNYSSGMYLFYANKVEAVKNVYYNYRINTDGISCKTGIKRPLDKVLVVSKLIGDLEAHNFSDCRLHKKLAVELYHFIRNSNEQYRVIKIEKSVYDFMMKHLDLRRKLMCKYLIKKNDIEILNK